LVSIYFADLPVTRVLQAIKRNGAVLMAVGVGSEVVDEELLAMASSPNASNTYSVASYDNLLQLQPRLVNSICSRVLAAYGSCNKNFGSCVVFVGEISYLQPGKSFEDGKAIGRKWVNLAECAKNSENAEVCIEL